MFLDISCYLAKIFDNCLLDFLLNNLYYIWFRKNTDNIYIYIYIYIKKNYLLMFGFILKNVKENQT